MYMRRINVSTFYVDGSGDIRMPPHVHDVDVRDTPRLQALCRAHGVSMQGQPRPVLMVERLNAVTLETTTKSYKKSCCDALYLPYSRYTDEADLVRRIQGATMLLNAPKNGAMGDDERPVSPPGHERLPDEQAPRRYRRQAEVEYVNNNINNNNSSNNLEHQGLQNHAEDRNTQEPTSDLQNQGHNVADLPRDLDQSNNPLINKRTTRVDYRQQGRQGQLGIGEVNSDVRDEQNHQLFTRTIS